MKIFKPNLDQFIKSPENILDITNSYITEVDAFSTFLNSDNLVIGYVETLVKHPDADTLSVTTVNLGNDRIEQIVCGASNVKQGQYVIVATNGAVLPGDFKIKKSKIRGVESNGMICSLAELGFNEEDIEAEFKDGIYYYQEPQIVGSNPIENFLLDGYLMELDLTPNRGDLLSHIGFARDLAAVLKTDITLPVFEIKESDKTNDLTVKIDSKNTNSYYARYFSDVSIKDSPIWLKGFLLAMGVKPINNIVDITNYILFTYGIPMHAFDALKFNTKTIVVKDNDTKQTLLTLDDSKVNLKADEILVTNGKEPMAIGGIMGLDNSKVDDQTTEIILEVASFNNESIRLSSKKLNLKSDSSLRFDRGIDEKIMLQALNHATYLIQELSNATVHKGISKDIIKTEENAFIDINLEDINARIGNEINHKEIINILNSLNYEVKKIDKINYSVKAPSYRRDIKIFADVLEEVVRIYGMDNVVSKSLSNTSSKGLSDKQIRTRTLRTYLSNLGLNEVITYSLMEENQVTLYDQIGEKLSVLKSMSSERTTLRQSLINGLINTYKYNKARKNNNINIFEIGNVYAKDIEQQKLSLLLSSDLTNNKLKTYNKNFDFYFISGILSNIMKLMNVEYDLLVSEKTLLHPYQQASIVVGKEVVGFIGKIHPKNILEDVFILELNLDLINKKEKFKYEIITKYPNVSRDIAFLIDEDIKMDELIKIIKQTGTKTLVNLELFDIYQGENIQKGKKSVAFSLTFNDNSKTLTGEDVQKLVDKILKRLVFTYQIEVRE